MVGLTKATISQWLTRIPWVRAPFASNCRLANGFAGDGAGLAEATAGLGELGGCEPSGTLLFGDCAPFVGRGAQGLAPVELVFGARVGGDDEGAPGR